VCCLRSAETFTAAATTPPPPLLLEALSLITVEEEITAAEEEGGAESPPRRCQGRRQRLAEAHGETLARTELESLNFNKDTPLIGSEWLNQSQFFLLDLHTQPPRLSPLNSSDMSMTLGYFHGLIEDQAARGGHGNESRSGTEGHRLQSPLLVEAWDEQSCCPQTLWWLR
jgi:hypothetical protein